MKSAKIRTLIIDDEPLARRNLRLLLEKDPQIEILEECRNGREAVKAINALSPDLIFLDIQMPEIDGFETCRRFMKRSGVSSARRCGPRTLARSGDPRILRRRPNRYSLAIR